MSSIEPKKAEISPVKSPNNAASPAFIGEKLFNALWYKTNENTAAAGMIKQQEKLLTMGTIFKTPATKPQIKAGKNFFNKSSIFFC